MHYTHPVEHVAISAQLSPNDLPFAEVRLRGGDGIIYIPAAYTLPRAVLKRQMQPSNIQQLWIELLPRSYDLPAYNYLHLLFYFLPILPLLIFCICLVEYLTKASIIQLLYKLLFITAIQTEIGLSCHKLAQIKVYSIYHCLYSTKELTKILLPTRNSVEQPGKSQPCRCKTFL